MALPVIHGEAAMRVIDELAREHPQFMHHIRSFGNQSLELSHRGLRDGREATDTYDISFVGRRGSFACITVRSGKANHVRKGRLRLEALFDDRPYLRIFKPRARRPALYDWHFAHLCPHDDIRHALLDVWHARR